uniref:DUF4371 domain-containing protein n=1 Tax=Nothobranchius furzeri TaxID=105023 RepID=A0A8C6LH54_NOTFU
MFEGTSHGVHRKSKKMHQSHTRGRGAAVTFLSKTTVNTVISTVKCLIQETIVKEVAESGIFSVQIDMTQDITSHEQCSVILRYVTDAIQERLLAVVKCEASTGQYFVQMLTDVMQRFNLDISNCVSNATDGASNMQGQYRGFSALLSSKTPNQVHVWCYAHVLNLVLADTTEMALSSGSLFSLINDIAVFICESYHRINVREQRSQDTRHRRLSTIGETKWGAKDVALIKIFGSFGKPDHALYIDVLMTLSVFKAQATLKTAACVKARGFLEALMRYETVLTAQLFLRIFEVTTPLSKYLQSSGLDILTAPRMVMATQDTMKDMARDFMSVTQAADTVVQWANTQLMVEEDCELELEAELPQKRKMMAGEMTSDETLTDPYRAYEVEVHNQIMDTITESIHGRFLTHATLYLPQVEEFEYLRVLFMSEGRRDREIDRRIGSASAVMRMQSLSVVVKRELSQKARLSIYRSIYVPILTYGHELWVMTERMRLQIQAAEMSFLRGWP